MAKVRTLKRGKTWSFAFEMGIVNGKRKTCQKGGFESKKVAYDTGIKEYDKYLHGGIAINDGKITLADFLDEWLEKDGKQGVRWQTYRNYEIYMRLHVKPYIGSYRMNELTPAIIDNWIKQVIADKKISAGVIKTVFAEVKKALRYAVYPAQIISDSPAAYVKLPHMEENKSVKRVIIPNVTEITSNLDDKYFIPIMIGYYTGMRVGEVQGLTWNDVDFKKGTISVTKQIQYLNPNGYHHYLVPLKTEHSIREVLVGNKILAILKKWKHIQKENRLKHGKNYAVNYGVDCEFPKWKLLKKTVVSTANIKIYNFICTDEYGALLSRPALTSISRFKALLNKDITFNFHSLRHTQATLAIENGAKDIDVANRLGDTVGTILKTYAHDTLTMQQETVKIFENIGS